VKEAALAWKLTKREIRGGFRGARIFILCLFLGVGAIATIGSLSEALLQGLARDGRALLGGDLDLRLTHREATAEQIEWLEARATLSRIVSMRSMLRLDGGDSLLVELKAVDALYPLYGALSLDPGQPLSSTLAPDSTGRWGLVADPRIWTRLGLEPGDVVRIGEADFRVTARLEREPDGLTRGLTFGPPVLVSREALAATGLLQPGSLVRHHYRLRLPPGVEIETFREELKAAFPEAGWRINDAREASPRVSRFLGRVALYLTLVGLSSLLIGGLGVANATRAFLSGKTATVATLKSLGASQRLIFLTYLFLVLSLAVPAVLTGVGVGAAVPFLFDAWVGDALGWRSAPGPYAVPLAEAALFGLLTAVTFALWPLAQAAGVSPANLFRSRFAPVMARPGRLATLALIALIVTLSGITIASAHDRLIAGVFVFGALLAFALFQGVARLVARIAAGSRQPRHVAWRLALANLHRPGAATGAVLLSLGLGLTLLSAIALIEANLARQVSETMPAEAPSFYFIDIQPQQVEAFERIVESHPGASGLQRVPMLRGRITAINGRSTEEWTFPDHVKWVFRGDRGLTWTREPIADAELVAGAWWTPDHAGPPLVSLDAQVGEALGIGPGDSLTINILGRDLEVRIANLRRIDWSDLKINFVMVFSPGLLERAPQTHLATVKVPREGEAALEQAIVDAMPNVASVRVRDALGQLVLLMQRIGLAVKSIAGLALVAGTLVLIGAVAADQERRTYDAVVLKVLGATRCRLLSAYFLEHGVLALISATLAAGLGSLAAWLVLTQVMRSGFEFLPWPLFVTLVVAGLLALLFGFAATFRSLGRRPAALLRNQ
jgi:putative ABC transport system permease protein